MICSEKNAAWIQLIIGAYIILAFLLNIYGLINIFPVSVEGNSMLFILVSVLFSIGFIANALPKVKGK